MVIDRCFEHSHVHLQKITLRVERYDQRVRQSEKFGSRIADIIFILSGHSTRISRTICSATTKKVILVWIHSMQNYWINLWRLFIYWFPLFGFDRRAVYGSNYIHVPVKSIMQLLLLEVLNPFYIFQVVSVLIWISIAYYYFAGAIMIMSAAGVVVSVTQTRRVSNVILSESRWILLFYYNLSMLNNQSKSKRILENSEIKRIFKKF